MFHSLFNSLARSKCLFIFTFSLIFNLWFAGPVKSTKRQILFFLLIITRCLLAGIRLSVSVSKSLRILYISIFRTCFSLYIYYLFVSSRLNLLFLIRPVPLPILWRLSQLQQPRLVSLSPFYYIVFFLVHWQGLCTYLSFCFLLFSFFGLPES